MMAARILNPLPFDVSGLRGELRLDEPMARHTSWRVGGPADYFYVPADKADVVALMGRIPADLEVTWLGLGSNLLVRDAGITGLVIKTVKALDRFEVIGDGRVYAEAGVTSSRVAKKTVAAGLAGAEFLAGVPGSFGGALAMNAGAFGGETWPLVVEVECLDRRGGVHRFTSDQVRYAYRQVELPDGMALLSGVLQLSTSGEKSSGDDIRELLERRSSSQPIQSANAGSVFKNPPGDFAARLVEKVGLKGHLEGGARVSEKHANFIINEGGASARDIERLIGMVRDRVREKTGVTLEPEVRIAGKQT